MKALQVTNLNKYYANGFHALQDINFSVENRDFFALLGPNGAGKSTLMGIISSLVNLSSGSIQIYGCDLQTQTAQAKALIGIVPQELNINQFERAINIILGQAGYYGIPHRIAYQRAQEYLKRMELWHVRNRPVLEFSGGMKRRLMIARALVHHPRLLILDEPTAGVDVEVRQLIWDCIQELNNQGTTIILTTHYLEEAEKWCRNIAIIHNGKIREHSSMRQLLNKLNRETYVIQLSQAITEVPLMKSAQLHLVDATTLELTISKQQDFGVAFDELRQHSIAVSAVTNKTSRLEELFLQLIKQ